MRESKGVLKILELFSSAQVEVEKSCSCCLQVRQGRCQEQAEGVEGDGQGWHGGMVMACPGTCVGSEAAVSTARHCCRELLKHLTERSDGGKKLASSG